MSLNLISEKWKHLKKINESNFVILLDEEKKIIYKTPPLNKSNELESLKNEFQLLQSLQSPFIVKAFDIYQENNEIALVLDYVEGQTLKEFLQSNSISLKQKLNIALQLIQALEQVHNNWIIHKDFSLNNLIYNPTTQKITLIDFGISQKYSHFNPIIKSPKQLDGTLYFCSPEQTGRSSQSLDFRSDLYSLGVCLYYIFANDYPFNVANNNNEAWIEAHLHLKPRSLHDLQPDLPHPIGRIIHTLLEKNKEQRYQSIYGLKLDWIELIEKFQQQANSSTKVVEIEPKNQSVNYQFQWPEKIYGRKNELETLKNIFLKNDPNTAHLILVGGFSGIGKTSLVRNVIKDLKKENQDFLFSSGKFDQFNRNTPYSAFLKIFEEAIKNLLFKSEKDLSPIKEAINQAVYPNGQVLVDFFPLFEEILGAQPEVLQVELLEEQKRLHNTLIQFFSAFKSVGMKVILFIDDLQWADFQSLQLYQDLFSNVNMGHFYVFGSYRDNEVNDGHPFIKASNKIKQNLPNAVQKIILEPLNLKSIEELLNDAFFQQGNHQKLAQYFQTKTQGNPFFILEMMKEIFDKNLLKYNFENNEWVYSIEKMNAVLGSGSVVDILINKLKNYTPDYQKIISLSSLLGQNISNVLVQKVLNIPESDLEFKIHYLVNEGIFLKNNNETLKFRHDRLQQAAIEMIDEHVKDAFHLNIYEYFLALSTQKDKDKYILEAANHLNQAIRLVEAKNSTEQFKKINLEAANIARKNNSFVFSRFYLESINKLVKVDNLWASDYAFVLSYYIELAHNEYAENNIKFFEETLKKFEKNNANPMDYIDLTLFYANILFGQGLMNEACDICIKQINALGVKFPKNPSNLKILQELFKVKIGFAFNPPENYLKAPEVTDKKVINVLLLCDIVMPAAYSSSRKSDYAFAVLLIIKLTQKYGSHFTLISALCFYSIIEMLVLKIHKDTYRYGLIFQKLAQQKKISKLIGRSQFFFSSFNKHWHNKENKLFEEFDFVKNIALQNGDITYLNFSQTQNLVINFYRGKNLKLMWEVYQANKTYLDLMEWGKNGVRTVIQIMDNLLHLPPGKPWSLFGETFNREYEKLFFSDPSYSRPAGGYLAYQLLTNYLFDIEGDLENLVQNWNKYKSTVAGGYIMIIFSTYFCLTYLKYKPKGKALKKEFRAYRNFTKKRAQEFPDLTGLYYSMIVVVEDSYKPDFEIEKAIVTLEAVKMKFLEIEDFMAPIMVNNILLDICIRHKISTLGISFYLDNINLSKMWGSEYYCDFFKNKYSKYFESNIWVNALVGGNTNSTNITTKTKSIIPVTEVTRSTVTKTVPSSDAQDENWDLFLTTAFFEKGISYQKIMQILSNLIQKNWSVTKLGLFLVEQQEIRCLSYSSVHNNFEISNDLVAEFPKKYPLKILKLALTTKLPLNYPEVNDELQELEYFKANLVKSILVYPLKANDKVIGLLVMENDQSTFCFSDSKMPLLNFYASQLASALENTSLYQNMDSTIKIQTQQIRTFLQNITLGIFQVNSLLRIENGYSPELEKILNTKKIANLNLFELVLKRSNLTNEQQALVKQVLECSILNEAINFEINSHLLPKEFILNQQNDLEVEWIPITSEQGFIERVMVVLKDITDVKKAKKLALAQKVELDIIDHFINGNRQEISSFIQEVSHVLPKILERIIPQAVWGLENYQEIFRNLHSFKGISRALKFDDMSGLIHEAEKLLIEFNNLQTEESRTRLKEQINKINEVNLFYQHLVYKKQMQLEKLVTQSSQGDVINLLKKGQVDLAYNLANETVRSLNRVSSILITEAQNLSQKMGIQSVILKIDNDSLYFVDSTKISILDFMFLHLIRNSIDHAFKNWQADAEEKPTINIEYTNSNENILNIVYFDNGSGLNLKKLSEKYLEKYGSIEGIEDQKISSIIWESGVSTADNVSDISGRGVGMDAVLYEIKKQNGKLDLIFTAARNKEGFRPFKLNIELPILQGLINDNIRSLKAS